VQDLVVEVSPMEWLPKEVIYLELLPLNPQIPSFQALNLELRLAKHLSQVSFNLVQFLNSVD
jgi:hypothetical protein